MSDVEEVEREAKRSKGILQVGQQLRYSTASRKIAGMVHDGEIGRIGFVRAQRMSSWYGPGTEEPVMRWLWSVEESGDQLVGQSIHNIDQINWVLDAHPVKCIGLGGQNMVYEPSGRDTSDHFTVVYEYPGAFSRADTAGGDEKDLRDTKGMALSLVRPYHAAALSPPEEPDWAPFERVHLSVNVKEVLAQANRIVNGTGPIPENAQAHTKPQPAAVTDPAAASQELRLQIRELTQSNLDLRD